MEMQFQKNVYDCLQLWAEDVKNEEQTQELRLPDAMPDIGTVLGAWGQLLIRSKEWRGTGMNVSGGVMVWVLYAPEDGSMVRTVEGWIPFQMHWDFPQTQQDGKMVMNGLLRSVDARCLSARKLMARASVSMLAQAMEPGSFSVFTPGKMPEDVQLLHRSYPLCYPSEAGEKMFSLDEELALPADLSGAGKLMYYSLQPEIIDQKIMADKVVFRGMAAVRGLFRCEDGELRSGSFEVPFSQYAQLDREYGQGSCVQVTPAVTGLELDMQEGSLRLKAALTGQYVIYDRPVIDIIEDAYSPLRPVQLHTEELQTTVVLDFHREMLRAQQTSSANFRQVLDASLSAQQPIRQKGADRVELVIPGSFALLGKDGQGNPQGSSVKWEGSCSLPVGEDVKVMAWCCPTGSVQADMTGEQLQLRSDVAVDMMTLTDRGLSQITGLSLGECREEDTERPGLILCRAGRKSLWELAKQAGSTVEAIREANGLQEEPEPERMLLIPVS